MRWLGIITLGALFGLGACSSNGEAPTDDDGSGGSGGAGQGGAGGSGGVGPDACLAQWSNGVFEVDPQGPDTQIHATSAFDGTTIWVAYSRPDGGSLFDNYLVGMACDRSLVAGPTEVTQSDDNELDPVVSVSGDRLIVAWTSDNGTGGTSNLDIRYRIYDLAGTPVTDALELAASRNGMPVTGNALDPALFPTDEGWRMAGAWGHDDAPGFQAFVVAIDRDGVVQGDAEDADLDPQVGQTRPAVAVDGAGVHLVWQEDTVMGMFPEAWARPPGGAATLLASPGARPDVAPGPWFAWDGDGSDVVVRTPAGSDVPLGLAGLVHNPSLAVAEGGAAISWMALVSGIDNRVQVARLGDTGELGPAHALGTDQVPSVYPIDLTMIDADHGVVVYQDGDNPAFRVKAELFTLP